MGRKRTTEAQLTASQRRGKMHGPSFALMRKIHERIKVPAMDAVKE